MMIHTSRRNQCRRGRGSVGSLLGLSKSVEETADQHKCGQDFFRIWLQFLRCCGFVGVKLVLGFTLISLYHTRKFTFVCTGGAISLF